jgi:hypothetical protein
MGFPLVLLLLIVKCSNNHPSLQYRKDEFVDIHSCNVNGALGQQQLQWQWGTGAIATIGRLQWQWGKRTGATAIAMALLGHRSRGNRTVIAMGQWRSISNGNGGGRLQVQWQRHWGRGTAALGQEHQNSVVTEQCCNRTVIAMGQWGNDRSSDCFISRINVMYCGC